jgi:spermidine/putrescine transport system ATP-binding protein
MLAGFETPTSGEILIDGTVVNELEPYRRPVNMVFQSYALFPHLDVAANIGYGLRQRRPRLERRVIADKVARALEIVRLSGFERRRIWEMSGGQQQRVALARAIINEPKLLLLDEPLAALDRKLRKEMQIELQDLQRHLGITFVLVTHDQEEALSLSDRICVMRAGRIVQIGTPQDLYDHPAIPLRRRFRRHLELLRRPHRRRERRRASLVLVAGMRLEGRSGPGCVPARRLPQHPARADPPQPRVRAREPRGRGAEPHLPGRAHRIPRPAPGPRPIIVLAPRQAEHGARGFAVGDHAFVSWSPDSALVLDRD